MTRHNWKRVGKSGNATVYVDYTAKKTKIATLKYVYLHKGIYPFHNYDRYKRYRKP